MRFLLDENLPFVFKKAGSNSGFLRFDAERLSHLKIAPSPQSPIFLIKNPIPEKEIGINYCIK